MRAIAGAVLAAVIVAGCGGGSEDPSPPSPPPTTETADGITVPPSTKSAEDLTESPSSTETGDDATEPPSPPGPETPAPTFTAPDGSVPSELVGEWDGDGTPVRFDKIRFSQEGGVSLIYNTGRVVEGTAVVDGTSMTLYVPGGPIPYSSWSIEEFDAGYGYTFENLMLDGVSYVRQIAGG
ncbi:hypothetical protein ACIQXA_28430 [Streptomyces massasporeus]|uniref:hypothetical protein n=1 Tax=Streptomyces massasporeus TaxID=67324 RepID=UPI00381777D1